MYSEGRGVAKNEAKAAQWFEAAAAQGVVHSQYNLGLCHVVLIEHSVKDY
jgi:TPR repeat protein